MKRIKLTDADLSKIVAESVNKILKEDGLGGTSTFSVNSPAGSLSEPTGQQKNHIDLPSFDNLQRRKIYSPKKGKKKDKKVGNIDMTSALARYNGVGGSISVNESSIGWDSKVSDLYERLKEMFNGNTERLMDEIVGKIDEKTLFSILSTKWRMTADDFGYERDEY